MSIKSSINDVSNILVFFIIIIITKIECWPVFKQDPPCLILLPLPWPKVPDRCARTQGFASKGRECEGEGHLG